MVETRRDALKKGFLMIGAAVGVGTAGKALVSAGDDTKTRTSGPKAQQLTLHGQQWHLSSTELRAGQLPDRGHRLLGRGELVEEPGGKPIGEFFATTFGVDSPGRAGPGGVATLEFHTFNLPGGTIVGTGTAQASLDAEDVFAIVGGTGQYVGARGSYVARQQPQEFGGDGTAHFTITLITEETADGRR
ncbi:MAG: hypothetical protein ACRD2W_12860 [Acidimicrobiales bacterium]